VKKWIRPAAGCAIIALTFLAFHPEVVVDAGRAVLVSSDEFDAEAWIAEARAGVEAGNPYWEMAYGGALMNGSRRMAGFAEHDLEADPIRSRALLESAAEKGLSQALTQLWFLTGRTDEAVLRRAVELGDPGATSLTLVALLEKSECTAEGRAAFEAARPSDEMLRSNHPDRVLARLAAYPSGPSWIDGFDQALRRSYEVAAKDLATDLVGIECAAKGTPIPDQPLGI
jgi:hypothetical protein